MSPALQSRLGQDDWSDGEVQDVAPALISQAGAARIVNRLLDEDGNPYRRGGTSYVSKEGLGSSGLRWGWSGFLLPGARTLLANESDFGVLGSDGTSVVNLGGSGLGSALPAAVLQDLLYVGGTLYGGSRKSAVYSTGTVSVTNGSRIVTGSGVTWSTLVDAGMLFRVGPTDRAYVVEAVNNSSSLTLRDAYQGATGSGKAYSLNPTLPATAPYDTFNYVTVCANRLVFGRGRTIKFTEVNNPHSFTNSHGTINEHTVPEGVEIVDLAAAGQTVLVFTTAGIWTLDGLALDIVDSAGNPQHRLERLSGSIILAGAPGVAGSGQQLVVPAGDGIYLMDGVSQPVKISRPINRIYSQYIADGYLLGGAEVYRGHYFLPILTVGKKVKTVLVCRLDRPTRDRGQTIYPWGRLSGAGAEMAAYFTRTAVDPDEPELLGAQAGSSSRLIQCSDYFEPSTTSTTDADGSSFADEVITRDFETGSGTLNVARALRVRHELTDSSEAARLQIGFSTGTAKSGGARFGHAQFGHAKFSGESGASFTPCGEAGPSDGRDPARLRINKRARFIRFRLRGTGSPSRSVLRSLDLAVRPSGAVRR